MANSDMPFGIDVASHQGTVNWQAVADAGIDFAWTKATGGAWYTNPTLAANWRGMKAAGIKRGAYHFAFESSGAPGGDPDAEADYFLTAMFGLGLEIGDMLALDIEDGSGQLGQWALRWLTRVEKQTGILPLLYTGAWFSVPHGFGAVPELARYPLWLAAYQQAMPPAPAPWKTVTFWQNGDKGSVPGVIGNVDTNVFNGPPEVLALYGMLPPPGNAVTEVEALRAENARLQEQVNGLATAVAELGDIVADAHQAQVDKARAIRRQFVGERPNTTR